MYTVISYRANGAVFYGGYCEGRTESDFHMETMRERPDAVWALANVMFKDMVAQNRDLNPDYTFTEAAEISLGINGYFGSEFAIASIDDEEYDRYCEERDAILAEAKEKADSLYSNHINNRAAEKARIRRENEEAAKRREEAAERAQLAKLQAKYGVING
jgi:hypothetical protein